MSRNRNIADVEGLDEERVALRIRIHLLTQQDENHPEVPALRTRVSQVVRQIAAIRGAERTR